jgi:hypothetical protein
MIWVAIDGTRPEFPDRTMVVPSCDPSKVDQLALDCLCFNFGTLVGRLICRHLDFVAAQDPYKPDSTTLASSIDVYSGELPSVGPSLLLRVSAPLPSPKRRILDYSKELSEFATSAKLKQILLVRSVPSVFCIGSQIQDWPKAIRGVGDILDVAPLEEYGEAQETLRLTAVGELFECLKSVATLPFGAVFMFVEEFGRTEQAATLGGIVAGAEGLESPPSWGPLASE